MHADVFISNCKCIYLKVTRMLIRISWLFNSVQFSSVTQSCPTLCDPMHRHMPGPPVSPTHGVYSNSCPSSQWCHPAISSSVFPFSSCPQSLPASGSFPMSQLFTWGGQSIGVSASASVLPMNIQNWSPLDQFRSFRTIRTEHGTTDWFQIGKGVCQGCILTIQRNN